MPPACPIGPPTLVFTQIEDSAKPTLLIAFLESGWSFYGIFLSIGALVVHKQDRILLLEAVIVSGIGCTK
jgi:hypothetical protein